MSAHAKFSPSAAHRWLRCPGSYDLTKDIPNTSSAAADEGTLAHEVLEHCLNNEVLPTEYYTDDATMAEYLDEVYLYVMMRKAELEATLFAELKVDPDVDGDGDCWGTADVVLVGSGVVEIIDLKYGAGQFVSVVRNEQLELYALGALNHPAVTELANDIETVITTNAQPRIPCDQGTIRSAEYNSG